MPMSGGCLCGKVRFEISADRPQAVRHCWCRVCQYLSGGAGTVNAIFPKEAVTATGQTAVYASTADSGTAMRRTFCPACGTQLFSEAVPRPHQIIVRVGALDDREATRPSGVIWTRSAPSWARIDPSMSQNEGQPPPR